jgi:hypothetical protein
VSHKAINCFLRSGGLNGPHLRMVYPLSSFLTLEFVTTFIFVLFLLVPLITGHVRHDLTTTAAACIDGSHGILGFLSSVFRRGEHFVKTVVKSEIYVCCRVFLNKLVQ